MHQNSREKNRYNALQKRSNAKKALLCLSKKTIIRILCHLDTCNKIITPPQKHFNALQNGVMMYFYFALQPFEKAFIMPF